MCGAIRPTYAMSVCVYCLCQVGRVSFSNPSAGAITDHNQSAKYIDSYLDLGSVEDTDHRNPVLILSNELSKPGEQAHDRNKFLPWIGFDPTTS